MKKKFEDLQVSDEVKCVVYGEVYQGKVVELNLDRYSFNCHRVSGRIGDSDADWILMGTDDFVLVPYVRKTGGREDPVRGQAEETDLRVQEIIGQATQDLDALIGHQGDYILTLVKVPVSHRLIKA